MNRETSFDSAVAATGKMEVSERGSRVARVRTAHLPGAIWGEFWQVQRKSPAANPMGRYHDGPLAEWTEHHWPLAVVVVLVETEDGAVGIGTAEDGVGAASAIIDHHLARLVLGQQAHATQEIWERLFRSSIPYGRRGTALHAISAIDLALWDLCGRRVGRPVFELLGSDGGRKVPAYASKIHPIEDRDEIVATGCDFLERGYTGVKVNFPCGPAQGIEGSRMNRDFIDLVRQTLGSEIELMTDAYMGWDLRYSRLMARELEPYRLAWLEEPLLPDEVEGHSQLRRSVSIPIATGEHEATRYGFQQLIAAGAADVLQPDVHRVGGLTESKRICALASAAGLEVAPHFGSPATVHLMLSEVCCTWFEHLTAPSFANPGDDAPLFNIEPLVENGFVRRPTRPGIGVQLAAHLRGALPDWPSEVFA